MTYDQVQQEYAEAKEAETRTFQSLKLATERYGTWDQNCADTRAAWHAAYCRYHAAARQLIESRPAFYAKF